MMNTLETKFYEAAKNILEKNLKIYDPRYSDKKVVLVYDFDSKLSQYVATGYIQNLTNNVQAEIIDFNQIDKQVLKDKLLSLVEGSTVVLVQSTNFRLDDFRIRLNLHNAGVGCLEHYHLQYMKDDEIETYANAISCNEDYYTRVSINLKNIVNRADTMEIFTQDGSKVTISGGFEDMMQNIGDYEGKRRGSTFPIGENFSEAKDFSNVNGQLSVYAYPDVDFQIQFVEPFIIKIHESILTCDDPKCPDDFRILLNKIADNEDGEVFVRELGFGFNRGISKENKLSDINAFERASGFHMSLGKKHGIYRKKFDRKIIQRFHIDIFPDIKEILIDGTLVFQDGTYLLTK